MEKKNSNNNNNTMNCTSGVYIQSVTESREINRMSLICNRIKGNESDVDNIDFEL